MSTSRVVTIHNRNYTFYTMPPTEAFPLLFSFFKTFGKPLAPLIACEEQPNEAIIIQFIQALSTGESEQVLNLFRTVFKYVRQEGCAIVLDDHFSGKNKELIKVFFYALTFNFADFLDEPLLTFVHTLLTA